jgi:hypothetical protein
MKRITLTVVAVLLAVPALAHAKAGIQFDDNIETAQPGETQGFSVFVHGSSGGPPTVSFQNTRTGKVIEVRTVRTSSPANARGSVTFPDPGPWTATLRVAGRPVAEPIGGAAFELAPPVTKPAKPAVAAPPRSGGTAFPWVWLTSAAAIGSALLVLLVRSRGRWGAA